ncbi:glycosyltransferase family 2 protein [Flavobacterium cerinum]|uniref:Glycosyltransferase n=1 Tax=Flavobacterium cerinum TaxID=2502784 RepID=A0ABY5IRN4_9FLAO|nr:glycosyltransferase [Flavobacterium cerinum]UUC45473.1 glycosyltransferase [Flavobacterium cerinum]
MISILIPAYNYDVSDLVRSLLKEGQSLPLAFEIICWDDCSPNVSISESNKALAQESEYYTYFRSETNLGRTQTRTLLAEKAKYNRLLFLDSDVMPENESFLKNYIATISPEKPIIFGGYQYVSQYDNPTSMLRWTYGRSRESHIATTRNKKPYHYIFSGNILIDKDIFLNIKFPENNFYGMDSYFSYQLYKNTIPVVHIDNPVLHLGLENNEIFFKKSLEAVKIRKHFFPELPGIENINSLVKNYNRLKRFRMDKPVGFFFNLSEPLLRKMILGKNQSLFCLDLYRLGYICVIK